MTYSLKIETGIYTGNGAVRELAPICDGPDFALTKRVNGTATVAYTRWRNMPFDRCNSPGGAFASRTNQLMGLTRDGIYLGSGQSQNLALYAYIAIKGPGLNKTLATGRYYMNNVDGRNMTGAEGCPFSPAWLMLHRATDGNGGAFRTESFVGDSSCGNLSAAAANIVQGFLPNGFALGNSPTVNGAAADYVDWVAFKGIPGGLKTGSFVGNGVGQTIDVGFAPTAILLKNTATTDPIIMLTAGMLANGVASIGFSAVANNATAITVLANNGFTVGAAAAANGAGNTIQWIALKDGEYL